MEVNEIYDMFNVQAQKRSLALLFLAGYKHILRRPKLLANANLKYKKAFAEWKGQTEAKEPPKLLEKIDTETLKIIKMSFDDYLAYVGHSDLIGQVNQEEIDSYEARLQREKSNWISSLAAEMPRPVIREKVKKNK